MTQSTPYGEREKALLLMVMEALRRASDKEKGRFPRPVAQDSTEATLEVFFWVFSRLQKIKSEVERWSFLENVVDEQYLRVALRHRLIHRARLLREMPQDVAIKLDQQILNESKGGQLEALSLLRALFRRVPRGERATFSLWIRGATGTAIAKFEGVSEATISRRIARYREIARNVILDRDP